MFTSHDVLPVTELLLDTLVLLSLDFGVTLDDDDLAPLLLDFVELLDFSEDEDFALEELDDFAELLLDTLVSLSLDCGVTLDDDDLASLLLDFVELLLDPSWLSLLRMTLSLLDDDSSQSSHTLEDEPSDGRVAKSLSSSPQATSSKTETAATTKEIPCFVFSITDPLPDSFVSDNLYNFATSPILTKIYNKSGIVEIALKSFFAEFCPSLLTARQVSYRDTCPRPRFAELRNLP